MKITSPILTNLLRSILGQSSGDANDAVIQVPPILMNVGSLPLPLTFLAGTGALNASQTGSCISTDRRSQGTTFTGNVLVLDRGIWDIDLHHTMEIVGAASDNTAQTQTDLAISGVGSVGILTSMISNQYSPQTQNRKFRIVVQKDNPVSIRHVVGGGAGTSTNVSVVSIVALRLL